MNKKTDGLLTLADAAVVFDANIRTLRAWVEHGRLVPVRRAGKGGGGGGMLFARGDVGGLVFGLCLTCGGGFKRTAIKQKFCSTRCRQRFARMKGASHERKIIHV